MMNRTGRESSARVFVNARLVSPNGVEEGQIAVEGGRITHVGAAVPRPAGAEVVDLGGLLVFPGIIDAHTHLRDFNHNHREDLETGTAAAAVGGVTTVIDMPNSDPAVVTAEAFEQRCARAEEVAYVDYGLYAWAGPETLEAMPALARAGAIGFKVFMAESNLSVSYITRDLPSLARIMETATGLDALVALHAENDSLIKYLEPRAREQRPPDLYAYLASRPPMVEEIAVFDALAIARWANTRVHICHVVGADAVDVVAAAKQKSSRVSCEVPQSNLFLGVEDGVHLGGLAKFSPPLRTGTDRARLWEALRSGVIDIAASDHAPQVLEDKVGSDDIWKLRAGAPWLEIGLSMMLDAARQGRLTIMDVARVMCERPARLLRLYSKKGCLRPGAAADLVVVDPGGELKVEAASFKSKAKYSPFDKWSFVGRPVMTVVRGRLVARDGKLVEGPGVGRRVRPLAA